MAFSFSEISTLLVFTSVTHTSSSTVRGCGEGWANHFSVQTRKEPMSLSVGHTLRN